jgi:DNA-binding SARP family transcriptional activator
VTARPGRAVTIAVPRVAGRTRAAEIDALRVAGRTREALELLRTADDSVALLASLGPEVLLDAGYPDAARDMLARGRAAARANDSRHHLALAEVVEAKVALRADRDLESAHAALDRARHIAGDGPEIADRLNTWLALALLLEGRDEEACREVGRHERATAAVYLAEASWRCGDEVRADAAADLALAAAGRQGSDHLLLQALHDFPAVLSRRLDSEPAVDSPWHALGRTLRVDGPKTRQIVGFSAHQHGVTVRLVEFGEPAILVGGERARPRIAKAVELLALLAARRQPVHRDEALGALFGERGDDSARAYLRQAVGQLRRVLPGDDAVRVTGDHLALAGGLALVTDSGEIEARVAEALRLRGRARLEALHTAIAPAAPCRYLPGVDSAWAERRRGTLAGLLATARFEAAGTALEIGRAEEARWLNRQVLAVEPLREAAWRQRMRIDAALGDRAAVGAALRGCRAALAAVGASPAASTEVLFVNLVGGFAPFPAAPPASVR